MDVYFALINAQVLVRTNVLILVLVQVVPLVVHPGIVPLVVLVQVVQLPVVMDALLDVLVHVQRFVQY